MKKSSKLAAILLATFAIMAQTAQAATAAALKTTIDAYGLSAAVTGNTVTVTGTKNGATAQLDLDIDASVNVIWQAELSGNIGNSCIVGCGIGPAAASEPILVKNSGSGVLEIQSGIISNTGVAGVAIRNNSNGTVKINGGTVRSIDSDMPVGEGNIAVSNNNIGTLILSGTPTIQGRIMLTNTNPISVDAAFAPGTKIYVLHYGDRISCMTVVKGGASYPSNFDITQLQAGWTLAARGQDLIIRDGNNCPEPSSSSSITPSSSSGDDTPIYNRENPQIERIGVQTKGMYIVLENLPKNTKVEVYNLQGKQIYSAHPENPKILRILVQTKGIYIIKIGNASTLKVPAM
jgi:hypothetical protein